MKNSTMITLLCLATAGGVGYIIWKKYYKKGCGCPECKDKSTGATTPASTTPAVTPAPAQTSQPVAASITSSSGSLAADGFGK